MEEQNNESRYLQQGEISIFEAIQNIETGKYAMPAFQRQYVWNMEQIEKLWDSVLSDFPISTFLFWHLDEKNTTNDTYFCTFMQKMIFKNSKKEPALENYSVQSIDINKTSTGILDGQQRLTSLYLSLLGETKLSKGNRSPFTTKLYIELDENKVETDIDGVNSKSYGFEFKDKISLISPTKFEIKKIINEKFQNKTTRQSAIETEIKDLPPATKKYASRVLNKLCKKIYDEKIIRYTEVFGMHQDDALEMFVRFNDGGKPLKKSDITMAIFDVYWPQARYEFGLLQNRLNNKFGTDFIVRTSLMLYGDVSKSCIDRTVANGLRDNWSRFKEDIDSLDEVLKKLSLNLDLFSDRWNVLLPIIYLIDRNPDYENELDGIRCYLLRAVFFTYFQNGTTAKLTKLRNAINDYEFSITEDLLDQIPELQLNEQKLDDLCNIEKGKLSLFVLIVLYRDFGFDTVNCEQDHIHPKNNFDKTAPIGVSPEEWRVWHKNRNKLPNLQLLDRYLNEFKSDLPFIDWYNNMSSDQDRKDFLKKALIPENTLLELKDFGSFYESRKEFLKEKIKKIISF